MNKSAFLFIFIFVFVSVAAAQDDYHKFEVSGNYSFERVKDFSGDRIQGTVSFGGTTNTATTGTDRTHNLNGFNAAAAYNFSTYFGAKFEFFRQLQLGHQSRITEQNLLVNCRRHNSGHSQSNRHSRQTTRL